MSSRTLRSTAVLTLSLVFASAKFAAAQATLQPPPGAMPPGQQQYAQQPAAGQPAPQQAPAAPFTLTPQEEAVLDRLLVDWQNMSAGVKTFEASFARWDYDGVFSASGRRRYTSPQARCQRHAPLRRAR
ncbi:MAG: hypothetical protein QM775_00255 [Pirellulales bacterium]